MRFHRQNEEVIKRKEMIKILGLMCLVGLASACCTVDQWEAFEGFSVGASKEKQGSYTEGGSMVSYDADRKMVNSFLSMSVNGAEMKLRVLQDYSQQTQYTLDEKTKKCTKSKIPTPFQKACVPPGSQIIAHQYFGEASSNFNVDVYKIPHMKGMDGYVLMTHTGCIPVSEGVHGEIAPQTYGVVGASFTNYTAGIKSESVFDVPSECKNATGISTDHTPMRFRLFY